MVAFSVGSLLQFDPGFLPGFRFGVGLGILALLILLFVSVRLRMAGRCKEIRITGDQGDLLISLQAVREFVARVVARFREASLHNVSMHQSRTALVLRLVLEVLPDTKIQPLADEIRATIIREAAEQLGVRSDVRVDIAVRSLSASEKRIAKAARKNAVLPESSGGDEPPVAARAKVALADDAGKSPNQ